MKHYEKVLLLLSLVLMWFHPTVPSALVCISLASLLGLKAYLDRSKDDALTKVMAEVAEIKERLATLSMRGMR